MVLEGISPFFALFCAFLRFFGGNLPFFALFFAFLRFILEQGANNCNLLEKWAISVRPRLHRPRWGLPDCGLGAGEKLSRETRPKSLYLCCFFLLGGGFPGAEASEDSLDNPSAPRALEDLQDMKQKKKRKDCELPDKLSPDKKSLQTNNT